MLVDERPSTTTSTIVASHDAGEPAHLSLFNTHRYHELNREGSQRYVRLDTVADDGRVVGSLAGVVDGQTFTSGHRAPFGGIDLVRDAETAANLEQLIRGSLRSLGMLGVTTVNVRARADCYTASEPTIQFLSLNLGFTVAACELNFQIELSDHTDTDGYVATLKKPARRALRHSIALSCTSIEASTDAEWAAGYGVIERNRRARERPMRLPFPYVLRVRDAFPGRVRMQILYHGTRPVAAALVYRIAPSRDYVVAWGDDHRLEHSPMNALAFHVVERSLTDSVTLLDLGISSEQGRPNHGLIQFKQSIGARPSLRLDLTARTGRGES